MLPLLAAGAIGIGSGLAGYFASMSAADRAQAIQDKELQDLIKIQIPDPAQQKLALQRFALSGELTPAFQQAIKAAPSEFNKVISDQGQKAAQNRALSELSDIGSKGGLRLQDKAALQEAQIQGQVQDRGARNAILDDMNRRGQGGSGFALQAQLQGQQAAGDRAARSALSVAGSAQDRALQSIIGAGNLATQGRGQDFQEQSARAQANDAINRFNTQNLQGVNAANVNISNQAQAGNLAARQRTSDQNVNLSNQEQQYNKQLQQQQFNNQLELAKAKNSVYGQQAQGELARGQTTANLFGNIGQAGVGAATQYGAQQAQVDASKNYADAMKPSPSAPTNFQYNYPDTENLDPRLKKSQQNPWSF